MTLRFLLCSSSLGPGAPDQPSDDEAFVIRSRAAARGISSCHSSRETAVRPAGNRRLGRRFRQATQNHHLAGLSDRSSRWALATLLTRLATKLGQPATPRATDTLRSKFKCPSLVPKSPSVVSAEPTPDDVVDGKLSSSSPGLSEPPSSPVPAAKVKLRPSKFKPLTLRPPPVLVRAEARSRPAAADVIAPQTTPAVTAPAPVAGLSKKPLPFVSPVVGSSTAKSPTPDSATLQRRVQLLKQAVQLLKPEGRQQEVDLGESHARWKTAGREVTQLLWDHGLSEPPEPKEDDSFGPLSNAFSFADGGFDGRGRGGPSLEAVIDRALSRDTADARRGDEGQACQGEVEPVEWTMGRMLRRVLRTDPKLREFASAQPFASES
jgi:hypothetical protein